MKKLLITMFVALLMAGCAKMAGPVIVPVAWVVGMTGIWEEKHPSAAAEIRKAKRSGATHLKLGGRHKLRDISPLAGLTQLERLYLGGNQISEDQRAMLRKALPDCEIEF